MAYHETALETIFEDSLSDDELEEGELAEDEQMDVDTFDGRSVRPEEGEVVGDKPSSIASLDEPEEKSAVGLGRFNIQQASVESGLEKDISRPPQQKKPNSKRSRKRSKGVNVAQFVRDSCKYLQEKKYPLVWAAVKNLGVDVVTDLIKEVDVIERCGGQMTSDGKRRRTPGGVMWNILRSRVQPAVYKAIMSQGNEVQVVAQSQVLDTMLWQKQKEKKAKDSLKRNRMDVDDPINQKRQKLTGKDGDFPGSEAPGKQPNKSRQPLRPAKELLDVIEGPQKDNSSLSGIHLQKAWAEGIKKKEDAGEAARVPVPSLGADNSLLKVHTTTASAPENNSVPVFERLRIPVAYGDLVTEKQPAHWSEGEIAPLEHGDVVEETLSDGRRQYPE